jgi:hypothetical protein
MTSNGMKTLMPILLLAASTLASHESSPVISGSYVEVRSCDVFIGQCFANGQMNLTGKEAILVWSVDKGTWRGARLDGLSVIAVVGANDTLGDQRYQPRSGKAVLVVDTKANSKQREALGDFARSMAGSLMKEVVETRTAPIQSAIATCGKAGCASVKAGNLVEISTRCIGEADHFCGSEDVFYPPLTQVQNPMAAYTEIAAYRGDGLDRTWENADQRGAFIASFAR